MAERTTILGHLLGAVSLGRILVFDQPVPPPSVADLLDAVCLVRNKPRSGWQGVVVTMPDNVSLSNVCRLGGTIP